MNILLYDDLGASPNSVKQAYNTLKALLGHAYDIIKIDRTVLQSEPWETGCAMLVMPGGRDLPYCEALNGEPNRRICQFVKNGGLYLGICAGAYYASQGIEFERGNPRMEIIQPRELGFYPGLSRGTTYPGFIYNSESGARSISVVIEKDTLHNGYPAASDVPDEIKMYYNGGGYFVHPEEHGNVTVLCRFKDPGPLCLDEPKGPAAVVHCKVGRGSALLIATHPEYDASSEDLLLADSANSKKVRDILNDLVLSELKRKQFLRAAFARLGLRVVPFDDNKIPQENKLPNITPLYMSGLSNEWIHGPLSYLLNKSDKHSRLLKDSSDIFHVRELDSPLDDDIHILSMCRVKEGKSPVIEILYPDTSYPVEPICPPSSMTLQFNLVEYYQQLTQKRIAHQENTLQFGNGLLYAEVIDSTQTMMEKNSTFLAGLPTGYLCLASTQIAGRGRGRNSWISQSGALQFSMILRHKVHLRHAPVVFIQYMVALSIVESIRERQGYEDVPLRLKWPNDIYVETSSGEQKKVGGILINSSFASDDFVLVIGCGLNLSNHFPTVSINDIFRNSSLAPLSAEDVLAGIIAKFEVYYGHFCRDGIGSWFLDTYYKRWLHSNTIVTLTTHNDEKVKVIGITKDHGMLYVESLDRPGKFYGLQPDGNSFDMMKGLLVRKIL
ncbi:class II aaRS and biotin synthetase [Rhizopus microsporus var. microsporus]|uniref:Class II aaRS and biotin synthetase n=2 Tax=Rhizopus microsporus TaxID=58291 RepID=A0A2G4SP60_RHIZD|nr:class II aaRS and biotin synthetase [Rhizopus microsporus ATCC 52813]ORE08940.1 class II aaRS and biotin synthetase [Rhizopus microsporus var. microsporus]PHZ10532.1 class II aaRS and biotin synthetase [Rhizopus microsporus ATCC 52813]